VVNASRWILKAWMGELKAAGKTAEGPGCFAGNGFAGEAANRAALAMRDAIRAAAKGPGKTPANSLRELP
jgi:hypothetical protein